MLAVGPSVFADRLTALETAPADFLEADEFIGFAFDRADLTSTDLWKYEEAVRALDQRLAEDPDDWRALTYRGNARSYTQDQAPGAAEDWVRAMKLCSEAAALEAIDMNLRRLRTWRLAE